jgi:2-C-methyl-D-erythritol 4-phosphate cytidylyltransferase/2-C-methyl-D-erythritol 2,4-cyclodiphosphate synthase
MTIAALIVAAGRGLRAGTSIPKQYQPVLGVALLRRTILALKASRDVSAIAVVIHPDDRALFEAASNGLDLLPPVMGGDTRQESVRLGLESLKDQNFASVLVHDAARPFPSPALIARVVQGLDAGRGVIPGIAVADSLKRVENGILQEAVPREGLWRAQTPQGFPLAGLLAAHQKFKGLEMTDDAAVAQAAGIEVRVVAGEEDNFKVTEPHDFARAEAHILGSLNDVRVGAGFDVHKFAPKNSEKGSDRVTLCGVSIPHPQGLIGHSDADVALHALTDALLGAIGAGDIGQHFPPSDARWKGAASDRFLAHAASLVAAKGGIIAHVDVTIICESPKIGPHSKAMIRRIGDILKLDETRVSVKATTTEGLGFTGRREGIAAEAVATIRLPAGETI